MNRILAIDIGTSSGWAVWAQTGLTTWEHVESGVWNFSAKKRHDGWRYEMARREYLRTIDQYSPASVCYELVHRHRGTIAAHVYGGYRAHLLAACAINRLACVGIEVGTMKKRATGNGHASKADMVKAARERLRLTVTGSDHADALWCGVVYIEDCLGQHLAGEQGAQLGLIGGAR